MLHKIIVTNFSGNVGKSAITKHILSTFLPDAEIVQVETINSSEGDADLTARGNEFGKIMKNVLLMDTAIVDVGSSNVEAFMYHMANYSDSHEEFDLFLIPVTPEIKQITDTISTVNALTQVGVPAKKIVVLANKVNPVEMSATEIFRPISVAAKSLKFHFDPENFVPLNEAFQKYKEYGLSLGEVWSDETDYRKLAKSETDEDKRDDLANRWILQTMSKGLYSDAQKIFNSLEKLAK